MIPATIYDAVISILTTAQSSGSLTYVKKILKGIRENVPDEDYPLLVVEVVDDDPREVDIANKKDWFLRLQIVGAIHVQYDPDKQIVGDATNKGILTLWQDVRKLLEDNRSVSGNAIDARVVEGGAKFDYAFYPVRSFTAFFEVRYRQTANE